MVLGPAIGGIKYMNENFDIDGLVSYSKEMISETKMLVNPRYRQLENELKSLNGKLSRQKALFGHITLKSEELEGKKLERMIAKKATVHQEIKILEEQIATLKDNKKNTDRKITYGSLPEQEQFSNAINVRKHFMDNIKMIAYRAETGMYHLIKEQIHPRHRDEGRKLLQQMYACDADIIPDYKNKTLTVKLHNLNYRKDDKIMQHLCDKLNETETEFPGTDLKLIYQLVSS